MSHADLERALYLAQAIAVETQCPFYRYFPDRGPLARKHYPKHIEFFRAGRTHMQRLMMAANRVGKTDAGAYEVTCHATGLYPDWWEGRRFDHPVEVWACGTTSETLRDIVQAKLFGKVDPNTGVKTDPGMVPAHLIVGSTRRPHGLTGSLETVWVRHVSGGTSVIGLKMYEQGRKSFEGTAKHVVWDDEEPPEDVYTEQLYRTATTKGITLVTFTPLQGMSNVVTGFMKPANAEARAVKKVVIAGWDDVPHLDPETKRALLATTPPFQREARTKGLPQLGSGAIYQIPISDLLVDPFPIPPHWKRAWGADTGGGAKPTAATWGAKDPASNILYVYADYRRESPEPAVHIAAIKAKGAWIPGVADAAALLTTADDAEQIIRLWQRSGLDVTLPDKAVESGIQAVWEMLTAGLIKVFRSCSAFIEEYEQYHRDEKGRVVKKNDHVMDAWRYLVYSGMKRAKVQPPPKNSTPSGRRPSSPGSPHAWLG